MHNTIKTSKALVLSQTSLFQFNQRLKTTLEILANQCVNASIKADKIFTLLSVRRKLK